MSLNKARRTTTRIEGFLDLFWAHNQSIYWSALTYNWYKILELKINEWWQFHLIFFIISFKYCICYDFKTLSQIVYNRRPTPRTFTSGLALCRNKNKMIEILTYHAKNLDLSSWKSRSLITKISTSHYENLNPSNWNFQPSSQKSRTSIVNNISMRKKCLISLQRLIIAWLIWKSWKDSKLFKRSQIFPNISQYFQTIVKILKHNYVMEFVASCKLHSRLPSNLLKVNIH